MRTVCPKESRSRYSGMAVSAHAVRLRGLPVMRRRRPVDGDAGATGVTPCPAGSQFCEGHQNPAGRYMWTCLSTTTELTRRRQRLAAAINAEYVAYVEDASV